MSEDADLAIISRMLSSPREDTTVVLAREHLICASSELRNALTRIDEMLEASVRNNQPCRIALFSDDDDKRLMIGAALVERAKELGFPASLTHSNFGLWAARVMQDKGVSPPQTHVLAGLPPKEKAQQAFTAVSGNLILLLPLTLTGAPSLPDSITEFILAPFAQRPLDKAAQLISSAVVACTAQDDEGGSDANTLLLRTPALALLAICLDVTKFGNVGTARDARNRLAAQLRRHSALRSGESLTAADLHRALFPQPHPLPPNIRRLWVEGDTDVSLFKLAAKLVHAAYPDEPGGLERIKIGAARRCRSAGSSASALRPRP